MNRAIFLDRDNTLIHNDGDLGDPAQVKLIQGVASAIASLRGLGYRIIVVSNQGGVARGKFTEAEVEATNARVNDLIVQISGAGIDRFYYCPYHPQGTVEKYRSEHPWRKPQPGMLLQACKDMQLDMGQSWMVGDQLRDVEAGAAAGVRTILLTPQAGAAQPPLLQERMAAELLGQPADKNHEGKNEKPRVMPDFVARNLIEAVRIIAQQRRPEGVDDWRSLEPAKSPRPLPVALSPATQRLSQTTTTAPATPTTTTRTPTLTPSLSGTGDHHATTMLPTVTRSTVTSTPTDTTTSAKVTASSPVATVVPAVDAAEVASAKPVEADVAINSAAPTKPATTDNADTTIVSPAPATTATPMPATASTPSTLIASPTAIASDAVTTTTREPGITVSKPFTSDIAATTSTTTVATPPTANESQIITVTAPTDVTQSTPTTTLPTAPVMPSSKPATTAPVVTAPASPAPVALPSKPVSMAQTSRPVQPQVSPPPSAPATISSPSMEQTLRQILAELRNQRQPVDEFNYTGVLAIVFQLLAVVCLLAALWMGRGDDGLFLRWMGVSLLTQLIAIAMLLFKR